MPGRWRCCGAGLALLLFVAITAAAAAQTGDPHRIYEQNCGGCHNPHAGDFARDSLRQADGRLLGRESGRDLRGFLEAGHGKLSQAEIDVLVEQLAAILQRDALFQRKCAICHDRSRELARLQLIVRDHMLYGRYSKREIADFLRHHGRLSEAEVPVIVEMLTRHLEFTEPDTGPPS